MAEVSVARTRSPLLIALAWMALALVSFMLMAIGGREASRSLDVFQVMIWRGLLSLPILVAIALAMGWSLRGIRTRHAGVHIFRSLAHFGAQMSWFSALALIPMAQLFALEFTAPLWVAVLAPLFLGERLTGPRLLAAGLGFAGAVVVVGGGPVSFGAGAALGLLSALGFATSMIGVKWLTRHEPVLHILFFMILVHAALAVLLAAAVGLTVPDPRAFFWVTVVAVTGLVAHFSLGQAFLRADAIIVAPMDFLRLPLIAVVGIMIYGEHLDVLVVAGALLVVAGNFVNIWREQRRQATPPAAPIP